MFKYLLIVCCLLFPNLTKADNFAQCASVFLDKTVPKAIIASAYQGSEPLCYSSFTVLYSAINKNPIWTAEHLFKDDIIASIGQVIVNKFHEEQKLPRALRALLIDYYKSNYDRGHMAPFGDMHSKLSQYESFSLANMVPQNPDKNRHLWEQIESFVRKVTIDNGDSFVITGPIYDADITLLNNKIHIPDAFFKAVFIPKLKGGIVFISNNKAGREYITVSISELTQMIGIDVFPSLSIEIKENKLQLTIPF